MHRNVQETCEQIFQYMSATWKCLPISDELAEPLPLHLTLERWQYWKKSHTANFSCIFEAIAVAIANRTCSVLVVEGQPGGGKTSALRWAARQFAKQVLDGSGDSFVPVYIDLGGLNHDVADGNLKLLLDAQLQKNHPIRYRTLQDADTRLVFLLDGLDLLHGKLSARDLLDQAANYSDHLFVISTRPDDQLTGRLDQWPVSVRLQLGSLEERARDQWVANRCGPDAAAMLSSIAARNTQARSLLEIPLLFAMTASACIDADAEAQFPVDQFPSRTGVLAGFVTYVLKRARRDGRLEDYSEVAEMEAIPILEAVCLGAACRGLHDRIPRDEINLLLKETDLPGEARSEERRFELWEAAINITQRAGLVRVAPDGESYEFLHQQFSEYLAARHLAQRLRHAAQKGFFEAELHEFIQHRTLDPVTVHALAILSVRDRCLVHRTLDFMVMGGRADACWLVASSGATAIADSLWQAAKNNDGTPNLSALQALEMACPQLFEDRWCLMALDPNMTKEARTVAINSLGQIVSDKSVEALVRLARDERETPEIRRCTIEALERKGSAIVVDAFKEIASAPEREKSFWHNYVLARAIEALGNIQSNETAQFLIDLARNTNEEYGIRHTATIALGSASPDVMGSVLIELAGNRFESEEIRRTASWNLRKVNSTEARQLLLQLARRHDENFYVRREAISALCESCSEEDAVALLTDLAVQRSETVYVRSEVIRQLGRLKPGIAREFLIAKLQDNREDCAVRCAAISSLEGDESDQVESVILACARAENELDKVHDKAVWALCKTGQ